MLTVQEKVDRGDEAPPAAELYVNLLEDEEGLALESDTDTASMSTGTVIRGAKLRASVSGGPRWIQNPPIARTQALMRLSSAGMIPPIAAPQLTP